MTFETRAMSASQNDGAQRPAEKDRTMLIHDTAAHTSTPGAASERKNPKDTYAGFVAAAFSALAASAEDGKPGTGAMHMRHRAAYEVEGAYERAVDEAQQLVNLATRLLASLERDGTAPGGNNYEGQAARVSEALHALRLRTEVYLAVEACAEREAKG
jgi:hypothetical protein